MEKHVEVIHFAHQLPGKLPRSIFPLVVPEDERYESGVKCAPLSTGRRRLGHMAKKPELLPAFFPEKGDFRVRPFRKAFRLSDEIGKEGLSEIHPLRIDAITVADKDASRSR